MEYLLIEPTSDKKILSYTKECTIGRHQTNDVQLSDQLVSRVHAKLFCQGNCWYLMDLGSRNGTFLNGRRVINQVPLMHQDVIEIGTTRLTVCLEDNKHAETYSQEPPTLINLLEKTTTILVIDIRGYCELSQKIRNYQLAKFISDWSLQCGLCAEKHGAFSHKSIGDSVMAAWIHPVNILTVLSCMLNCVHITDELTARHAMAYPIKIGAGVNTGKAMVGNNGSGGIQDFSPLGDIVNATFRYESATRQVGCDFLIGSGTAKWIPFIKELNRHQLVLKGYTEPHVLYGSSYQDLESLLRISNQEGLDHVFVH